ncbi:RagB/SusD family nutrient uptake outer membrane protein [Spirosoma endbachense]|uniref:RagB/SusD family nutrient uptake outer membrane protein n=1 Tax=Spirosoma endbachense TaxID=2666025 RepID=A0A6P1VQ96_9BACT|nr:RagB/SusD family nutrient uptake outer membrane protein [Spirosoma endbachense]QHV94150.1 RagB/SusD family nutrient uptake outer membrane protein [Spirosoma endbachense]
MKKSLFLFPFLCLFACQEELIEQPKSLAVETYYNTAAEVESAVNAIYSPLRNDNCLGGLYPAQLEAYTDYSYGRGSYGPLSDFQGLNSTNITRVGQIWDLLYLAIRNANLVISNAPKGKSISAADISRYVAEAKFLRAFTYFTLVRNWSGVPIRTETNMTEQNIKRNTAAEVYALIQTDLADAETNLPDKPAQTGRPSKWAAKTLLADVNFYQGKYAEARDKADEVIKSGKYSLVSVTVPDDFNKIFGPDVITTTEEIFYLKFTRQNGQGFNLVMFAHHPGSKLMGAGGFYAHFTDAQTNNVYKNWDNADLRKKAFWYNWDIGLGANSYLNKKFIDPLAPGASGAGNDDPVYRYADILLLYAEAANRAGNGPTAAAVEALNQVHRRAFGKNPTVTSSVDFKLTDYTTQTFNDLVLQERGYETQYEAKRWFDLKRLGADKLKAVIKAGVGKDVLDKMLLWPIPVSELNYNIALDAAKDQNPGY